MLAFPMILANVTTPLVGLVDTAVLGRMDNPAMLAGASVSTLIITQIVWICGFLRMSTTGRSAQAHGEKNQTARAKVMWQSLLLAVFLALLVLAAQTPLFQLGMKLADLSGASFVSAQAYFDVRILSLPAAFANLVLVGWLVGQQCAKQVLVIQVVGNSLNAILNLVFVYGFNAGVEGVAAATVTAEVVMMLLSMFVCFSRIPLELPKQSWFTKHAMLSLFATNGNMFLRNLVLQACLAFVTLQGARYGVIAAGVNAMIMQFFALIALGLDGIAYAVEALVGKAKGEKNRSELFNQTAKGLMWSSVVALCYALVFALFHSSIAATLTHHTELIVVLKNYFWILILLPLLGHWCFLFDGVAVGLTESKAMRNTMALSAILGFFPVWWLTQNNGNLSLWYAMLAFLTLRGLSLSSVLYRRYLYMDENL
jgi:MATE family multidrug resistance protein